MSFNNNNPTYSLIAEAIQQGYSLENINVISLGTGYYNAKDDPDSKHSLFWTPVYGNSIVETSEITH